MKGWIVVYLLALGVWINLNVNTAQADNPVITVEVVGNTVVYRNGDVDHTIPISSIATVSAHRKNKVYWIQYFGHRGDGGLSRLHVTKDIHDQIKRILTRFEE